MRCALVLSLLVCGPCADLFAQAQQIPLPAYDRTFSSISLTRGFWFQAPIPFVIDGLRVPDENGAGTQNVEVFLMSSAPPVYSASATGGQAFYAANVPSGQIINTGGIFVQAGDYVGVLGACGTSTMHNSYAARGAFASTVLGAPITLTRFLTQSNLNRSGGNQPYSTEPQGAISRVEVYVRSPAGYSSATPYGAGCNGVALGTAGGSRPVIGTSFQFEVRGIPANSAVGAISIGDVGIQPPLDLTPLGLPGCFLHAGILASAGFTPTGATFVLALPIPAAAPAGLKLYSQAAVSTPGQNPLGFSTSNGLELTIDRN